MDELQKQIDALKAEVEKLKSENNATYRQLLRLTNALQGSKVFYVSDSSGGAVTRKLTFKDGILTLQT